MYIVIGIAAIVLLVIVIALAAKRGKKGLPQEEKTSPSDKQLVDVANASWPNEVGKEAFNKITDESQLLRLAVAAQLPSLQIAAVKRMKNPEALQLAIRDVIGMNADEVREAARERLEEVTNDLMEKFTEE